MEQVFQMLLTSVAASVEIPQAAKPSGDSASQPGKFKELMQQKKEDAAGAQGDQTNEPTVKPDHTDDTGEHIVLAQELLASQFLPPELIQFAQQPVMVSEEEAVAAVTVETGAQASEIQTPVQPAPELAEDSSAVVQTVAPPKAETAEVLTEEPIETVKPQAAEDAPVQPLKQQPMQQEEQPEGDITRQWETSDVPAPVETPLFKDVQTVPIKVAETDTVSVKSDIITPELQVDARVLEAVQNGESRVEIQLNPASLGHVTVEIFQQENGALRVVMEAASLHTQKLLEKHMPHLQTLLADHGQRTVEVEFQQRPEGQQADNQQNFQERQGGGRGQGQQQEHKRQDQKSHDFMHQLRLGLVPMQGMA